MSIDHYQVCTTCDAVIETARRENFAPNRVKRLEDELAATYADFRLAKASSAAELEDYTRVRRLGLERHVRVQPAVRGWRLGKMGWTATGREGEVVVDLLETFLATDGSFWSGVDVDTKHPSWRKRQVKEIAKPPKFVAYDLSGIHLEGLEEIIAKLKAMM